MVTQPNFQHFPTSANCHSSSVQDAKNVSSQQNVLLSFPLSISIISNPIRSLLHPIDPLSVNNNTLQHQTPSQTTTPQRELDREFLSGRLLKNLPLALARKTSKPRPPPRFQVHAKKRSRCCCRSARSHLADAHVYMHKHCAPSRKKGQ